MGATIHPTAVIEGEVRLGDSVEVGPYAVVSGRVRIGAGTRIGPHALVKGKVEIGPRCTVFHGCCIGEEAQSRGLPGERVRGGGVSIGADNALREFVTVHASAKPGGVTRVGERNRLFVHAHVAHDCDIGNDVTVVNACQLGGWVVVQDHAYIAGGSHVVERCRIGRGAFVGASSLVARDVPPFTELSRRGALSRVRSDLMRRLGLDEAAIRRYVDICRRLRRGETWRGVYDTLRRDEGTVDALLREFLRRTVRGLSSFRRTARGTPPAREAPS